MVEATFCGAEGLLLAVLGKLMVETELGSAVCKASALNPTLSLQSTAENRIYFLLHPQHI